MRLKTRAKDARMGLIWLIPSLHIHRPQGQLTVKAPRSRHQWVMDNHHNSQCRVLPPLHLNPARALVQLEPQDVTIVLEHLQNPIHILLVPSQARKHHLV
jgi:hypothetical protein